MGSALAWGAVSASSLVVGMLLGLGRPWPDRQVGIVLAFGAGALISAVSFELAEEGVKVGGLGWTAVGLGLGAMTYFSLDGVIERRFADGDTAGDGGVGLALGAFLDGLPEQAVLGIGLASGAGVGVSLLVAIFVSNVPEAIGSARDMQRAGTSRNRILLLWSGVATCCALATVLGYAVADAAAGKPRSLIDGFAAGALIVMLIDSMIPEATRGAGRIAGLATTLGFAVATALSTMS
jgi:zinc transporter, ZIP family